MSTQVHKFGGTSVKDADRINSAAGLLVEAASRGTRVVGVSSAMAGVTNAILDTAAKARTGDRAAADTAIAELRARHHEARMVIAPGDAELQAQIDELLNECLELLHGTAMLRELTPRVSDRVVVTGEKLAVRLLAAAVRGLGAASVPLDADSFLRTTDAFGAADPLSHTDCPGIADTVLPHLKAGAIPVVTGFCGRSGNGATTTFGRGGSDLTATLVAAALRAESCVIWTDVAGAYTADPRIVPEATPIGSMHPREAAEMSFYGAKVLHPRTMIPVASLGIPVWIKSSFEPTLPGTLIDARPSNSKAPVRAVTAIREQALVSIEGKGMAGVPGIAARVFGALAEHGLSMTMISQSSSESSVCFALPEAHVAAAETALKHSLRSELADGLVEEIRIKENVAIVAAVGMGMIHTTGVAGRVLSALGKRAINILAIAQGSSELNISLAVEGPDAQTAVQAVHDEFFGPTMTGDRLDIAVRGFGGVGQQLARLITNCEPIEGQPTLRLVAVSDRSGAIVNADGLGKATVEKLIAAKSAGNPLAGESDAVPLASATDLVALLPSGAPTALADCTDDGQAAAVWIAAFAKGLDLATANKDPLAAQDENYAALMKACESHGRALRGEATVGAALPVIDTLAMLRRTGDDIFTIEGSLSGSLGFVLSEIDSGSSLSDAVSKAGELGYTEPDPAIDLSGHDVVRKALILGRLSGLLRSHTQVSCEGLVDGSLIGASAEVLAQELDAAGVRLAKRVQAAKANGSVLRFVAHIKPSSATVGLREVPADSPMASLSAAESLVAFTTRRYHQHPLQIRGAGAGAQITASAMLTDLLRISVARCRVEHVVR